MYLQLSCMTHCTYRRRQEIVPPSETMSETTARHHHSRKRWMGDPQRVAEKGAEHRKGKIFSRVGRFVTIYTRQ